MSIKPKMVEYPVNSERRSLVEAATDYIEVVYGGDIYNTEDLEGVLEDAIYSDMDDYLYHSMNVELTDDEEDIIADMSKRLASMLVQVVSETMVERAMQRQEELAERLEDYNEMTLP